MTIAIIGAGNMGSALCKAFIKKDVTQEDQITLSDPSSEKLKALEEFGVKTSQNNQEVLQNDFIIIAVKPQGFSNLAKEIAGKIPKSSVVLSIMAGIPIGTIKEQLLHEKVVRSMPNTPALVNEGVIAWFADQSIDGEEKNMIQIMLESAGYAFNVKKEEDLDSVGCISGSGPGFFFYLIEQWIAATENLELDKETSRSILMKTLMGSLKLAESSNDTLETLREKVTSKGGITEAGLKELKAAQLKQTFEKMLGAAAKRTKELNQ